MRHSAGDGERPHPTQRSEYPALRLLGGVGEWRGARDVLIGGGPRERSGERRAEPSWD